MEGLVDYLESCSEGVLHLLENGKKRGHKELQKGNGLGTYRDLFLIVVAAQRAFLTLHERCRTAVRFAHGEEARDVALDVQSLLYLFSRQVYDLAFSTTVPDTPDSFPSPGAYSRHYPGAGPENQQSHELFLRYFGDTIYTAEKSRTGQVTALDSARNARLNPLLQPIPHP